MSSGPSGITIPHMKAHGSVPYLAEVDALMAHLPYLHGFSPERWQKGRDIMLEKKPGIRQINTLRAILLYEADFNQNNKRLGREMLHRAEKHNAVAPEQYGSRKNMSAVDQSLNKALTFDLWRQQRQRGALCSNDAKSCYDRIVHNVASLCMQRVGTPPGPIESMFQTIQSLSHHVRTVFGESESGFKHEGLVPIQGVGQGNGAGPQIWALISTPVLNMLRAQGHGASFRSAISQDQTTLVGFSFVDDTDLVTSRPDILQQQVFHDCQNSLTAWEGGIRATGGAIEPQKSHWYLVDFNWKDGSPEYQPVSEISGILKVKDTQGVLRSLQLLEPWHAERTLGVRLAPDGNMEAQYKWMLDTAEAWADKIRAGYLPRHLTWLAWKSTIQKTLEYPLPITTLTRKQRDKISSTLASAALPRCGFLRTFPRALVYAPVKVGGLEIPNLFIEQGIGHILRLIRYSQSRNHSTGKLLCFTCEAFKLQVGCNGRLTDIPWVLAPLATPSWIKSTWEFLQEYNSIHITNDIPDFQPLRVGDRLIIPTIAALGFSMTELQYINQC